MPGVEVIERGAFNSCEALTDVECGKLEIIGESAFFCCESLGGINLPSAKIVEGCAFWGCTALTNVIFGKELESALTDVECGKLEIIRHHAFDGCKSLGSINLPSARIVEDRAFNHCKALMNVKFGKELESIRYGVFDGCTSLERIAIPLKDGMITADDIFQGCENLKHVDLVEGGGVHETIAALLLEEWKNDMKDKLGVIDQILPTTPAARVMFLSGGKAQAVRMWIRSVLHKLIQYKAQHRNILDEYATALQHTFPKDIVLNNILPFLELPSFTFEGENKE